MSTAPPSALDQAQRLVEQTRLLPADEAAKVLEQVVGMAQAAQAERLVAAERSGEIKDSGCRTVRSFATTILRRGVHDADAFAQTARHLVDLPLLAVAYRAGRVHTGNLRAILKHRRACGLDALQAHEDQLVLLATQAGPKEIVEFCQMLADVNRPDRDEAKAKALGLRSVRIVRVGDLARLDAMLDPAVAAELKGIIAAMTKAARAEERRAERAAKTDNDTDSGAFGERQPVRDPRTHGERSADALEELLRRGMADTDRATAGRARSRATVSVQLETLLGMGSRGRALLHRFGVVGTKTAERLSCDALVRLIVKQGERVLNVGDRKRVVTARQRAALAERCSTCVVPGCRIPFGDCDIHHLWWWSLSGPTDFDLQLPVCSSHHIWLHEGGYSITLEDGVLVFRDPHGRQIANLEHILETQLDLLHQQSEASVQGPPATTGPAAGPRRPWDSEQVEPALNESHGWPDSPYRHGTWGWTGKNPGPPPGHAPPHSRVS